MWLAYMPPQGSGSMLAPSSVGAHLGIVAVSWHFDVAAATTAAAVGMPCLGRLLAWLAQGTGGLERFPGWRSWTLTYTTATGPRRSSG